MTDYRLDVEHGYLEWRQKDGYWSLEVYNAQGKRLAFEDEHTGYWTLWDGKFCRLDIPSSVQPETGDDSLTWRWQVALASATASLEARFTRMADRNAIEYALSFAFDRATARPHISWGLDIVVEGLLNQCRWVPGPTHTAYTFSDPPQTLWMISTYDPDAGITKFNGCQALITIPRDRVIPPDPADHVLFPERRLEMHVRMPPGYEEICARMNILPAGTKAYLHGALLLADGHFGESVKQAHRVQPLEILPPRFDYAEHVHDVVAMLKDPNKWFEEHEGIMYHNYGNSGPKPENALYLSGSDPLSPTINFGREGPGWGGPWDTEMAHFFMRYRNLLADETDRDWLTAHVRRMIDGWLTNAHFAFGDDLTWHDPGDMRGATSSALEWKRRGHPPVIWTAHQAYMIYFLVDLYRLGGWEDCLERALIYAEWFVRNQDADGGIPSLWRVEINRAIEWRALQPASVLHMVSALLKLHEVAPDERWLDSARRLADHCVDELMVPLPEWGQGEMQWLVWDGRCIDPTGIAYIIWAYADAYEQWPEDRYRQIIERYGRILLALGATWDPHEMLLRGPEKTECPPYGMDLKIAGGFSHGNFRHFWHIQMNRNEIGYGLLRAYEVLDDPLYRDWLVAFVNWHLGFVFTQEVEFSPVTTFGSSPQNHRWTSNRPNWCNDWGTTAAKMASLILELIERGYL